MTDTGKVILSAIALAFLAYYVPAILPIAVLVILIILMTAVGR